MAEHALGWREPDPSYRAVYETKYALAAAKMPDKAVPVVIGINWYTQFDRPVRGSDGAFWIGAGASWGTKRGGHAVCLRPPAIADLESRWKFANQGREGSCVGWACSAAQDLNNRRLYSGFPLYERAKTRDPWPGSDYEGTTVEAGLNTLRLEGAWPSRNGVTTGPVAADGISGFLWARSVDEVRDALKTTEPFARLLNSWGTGYPREVRVPWQAIDRLMREGGEFAAVIDRPGASAGGRP